MADDEKGFELTLLWRRTRGSYWVLRRNFFHAREYVYKRPKMQANFRESGQGYRRQDYANTPAKLPA